MVNVIRAVCVISAMLCVPAAATAQTGGLSAASVAPREAAGPPATRRQSGIPSGRRDSLWNGVVVGAGLGALIGAIGGQAILECSECAGFNVPLTFGVIGAGVGAGIGAGIDALRQTRSPVPNLPARITVAPLLGKRQRAVVAVVRF